MAPVIFSEEETDPMRVFNSLKVAIRYDCNFFLLVPPEEVSLPEIEY